MKYVLAIAALAALSACNLTTLPQGECGDGYVEFKDKCIKPGMAVGSGVIETGAIIGAGALVANGVVAPF